MWNSYAVPEKKIRIQRFKYRLPLAAVFFIVKFINRLEFFIVLLARYGIVNMTINPYVLIHTK